MSIFVEAIFVVALIGVYCVITDIIDTKAEKKIKELEEKGS